MIRRGRRPGAGWLGCTLAFAWLSAGQGFAQPDKHLDPLSWDRNVQKLFRTHCYDCHNADDANGGVDLKEDADPRLIRRNRDTWLGVVHVLTSGEMPPADANPQPTEEDRRLRRLLRCKAKAPFPQNVPTPKAKLMARVGEEPPPLSPARGPPTDWGELVQAHDDRDVFHASPDELPVIDIPSL